MEIKMKIKKHVYYFKSLSMLLMILGCFIINGCGTKNGKHEIIAGNIFTEVTLPSHRILRRTERVLEKVRALLGTYSNDRIITLEELFSQIETESVGWNAEAIDIVRSSIEHYMRPRETAGELKVIVDIVISKYWPYKFLE